MQPANSGHRRIIVGISGASGAIYGIRLLEVLRAVPGIETHLVCSKAGERTIVEETAYSAKEVMALASVAYPISEIGACIASGSFLTEGMVVAPCSVHTASAIAHCISGNLLTRAADVVLKERRRLVLLFRETPLHLGHLKALSRVVAMGAIVMPPVPAFYTLPKSLDDVVNHTVGRVLDLFGVPHNLFSRWGSFGKAKEG